MSKATQPALFILLLIPFFCSSQTTEDPLTTKLSDYAKNCRTIGFGVSLFNTDSIIYCKGFGFADKDSGFLYNPETVQPIASISKTLISVCLMKAEELGMLKLDDDINQHLPFKVINPGFPNQTITVRHLATHTSGIKDTRHYEKGYVFSEPISPINKKMPVGIKRLLVKYYLKRYNHNQHQPLLQFLERIYSPQGEWYNSTNFYKKAAGKSYHYSNNGAALAALVIEGATGMSYIDFVKTTILNPLDMNYSGWSLKEFPSIHRSSLYFEAEKIPGYELITYPDGGFVTNLNDFSRFMMAMMRGYRGGKNILSDSACTEMMKLQINPEYNTGIFWDVRPTVIGHTGADPGVNTLAYFSIKKNIGFIIFTNTSFAEKEPKEIMEIFEIIKNVLH